MDLKDKHVLVVDDNITNRKYMRLLLKNWKCQSESVSNGPEGRLNK